MSIKYKISKSVNQLRFIGYLEGISFLILLFISMPLKYYFDLPLAVKYNGWAHGVLFILYILVVLRTAWIIKWDLIRTGIALAASLVPFATFILDRKLKRNPQIY